MAYINVDIEEHLDGVDLRFLIEEIAERYERARTDAKKDEIRTALADKFNFFPKTVIEAMSVSIDELSKRELIEEFINKLSYDQLKSALEKLI